MLTAEQAHDLAGVVLAGVGLLGLVALVAPGAPLLAGLRSLLLAAMGAGAPLLLAAAVIGGALMAWPASAAGRQQSAATGGGGHQEADLPSSRRWTPTWLEVPAATVGALAVLGLLSRAHAPAGGAGGRLAGCMVAPAGPAGGLLILLLFAVLAAIVVLRLSPGRAVRGAVAGARVAYAACGRAGSELGRVRQLLTSRFSVQAPAPTAQVGEPVVPAAGGDQTAEEAGVGATGDAPVREPVGVAAGGDRATEEGGVAAATGPTPEAAGTLHEDEVADESIADDQRPRTGWRLPGLDLLTTAAAPSSATAIDVRAVGNQIVETLATFGVKVRVSGASRGPAVTRYALQPAEGVQVRKVVALQNDLALALGGVALRIEAPIPGQAAIGVEVPNRAAALVTIGEVVRSAALPAGPLLAVAVGKDVAGRPVAADLTRMPHLLIAGATGQGKSVELNTLICSLLLRLDPDQLLLVLIDPKRVELQSFNGLPHLAVPVIVDPEQAASALRWAVGEMERRYKLLAHQGVRNIASYNPKAIAAGERPLPYVVIVIDELADLMMVAAGEIEELVCRIAQLARAVGIHLVIATQRPSRDIITGLIAANVPSRIAFAVGSQVDSRVILDAVGAEKLLGRGDMLYQPVDAGKPTRLQGAFISDHEVEALVGFWTAQGEPRYLDGVLDAPPLATTVVEREERALDSLFARAARTVAAEGAASVSLVQRKFNVGYSRAGRIVDALAEHRVIGAYQGSKSREVLMDLPDVDELLERLGVEG